MITILRGPLSNWNQLDVPSGRIDLRRPKIIVGISLTPFSKDQSFPQGVITMPAILDTGFNRTLEIDEWHLVHWAGLRKERIDKFSDLQISQAVPVGMVSRFFR